MTDQELRDLVAETSRAIARMSEEAEKGRIETEKQFQETAKQMRETDKRIQETDKQIKKLGREIGYIGNSWGRFTEGLFTPSLDRILEKDFGLEAVVHRARRRNNGSNMEIDVLGYSNSEENTAVVVEIKATLRDADIKEFVQTLGKFPNVYTEHRGKKILGMMAAVDISPEQKARLERHGIYVVRINDDVFRVISSKKFEPKNFGLKS
jgi:hypothetical protein